MSEYMPQLNSLCKKNKAPVTSQNMDYFQYTRNRYVVRWEEAIMWADNMTKEFAPSVNEN